MRSLTAASTVRSLHPIRPGRTPPCLRTSIVFLSSSSYSTTSYSRRFRFPRPASRATVLKAAPTISFLSAFFGSSTKAEKPGDASSMSYPDKRSEDEWRAVLSPEQFYVLREKGTERAYVGKYDSHYPSEGVYTCAGCDAPLYRASHKFKSGCGWPAYFDSIPGAVKRFEDNSLGMQRTEIVCSNCGGHLGHVFKGEGYPTPTDERHCVNSISLKFTEDATKAKV
ncbi:hypothetical protein MAP00_007766 [Monascus purpureus]|nr:hypothetical protein MAP00_007766 [Monascus purpureus]